MNTVASVLKDYSVDYDHQQAAHCESGAISGLLRHAGVNISEPLAFGIGGGLTFAYLPFMKFGGQPMFAYRMPPGRLIATLTKRLGIGMHRQRFKNRGVGMMALDEALASGRVVGLQTSAYWLSYFPPDMRFHFNAHNLVVYGKRNNHYLISDPVIDILVECEADALEKARFTRGVMAPKGLMYYPEMVPENINIESAIKKSIRATANMMLYAPLPLIGISGIRKVAHKVRCLNKEDIHKNKLLLGHIVRMQEEIGTGGAGFRFLYAFFLQEAAAILNRPGLNDIANELTTVGDEWRQFALDAARMCKDRKPLDYEQLSRQITQCADGEKTVFKKLRQEIK